MTVFQIGHTKMEDNPHIIQPNESDKTAWEYLSITTDYISLPLGIVSVVADILIIMVILRYKRLRNRTNLYLVHLGFSHIFYILSMPLFYIILDMFFEGQLEVHWFCLWTRSEFLAMALTISFTAGFGIDVIMEAKKSIWFYKYRGRIAYSFSFIYFFHGILFAAAGGICFKVGMKNDFYFYFITSYYILVVILLLYFGIQNRNTNLITSNEWVLNISILLLLFWLPLFVIYNLMNIFRDFPQVDMILWNLAFLPEYLACSLSLITMWKLWKSNKHFKSGFRTFLRRPVAPTDYEELFKTDQS